MRRAGLSEHRAVVAERRGLGSENELDMLEPLVRERAERWAAGGGLSRGLLVGADAPRGALGLDRLNELDGATAGLVLGQVPGRRAAAARSPAASTVAHEPRVHAEPSSHPLAIRAAPLDCPYGLAGGLGRLDQEEGRRQWVVSGHRTTTVHPPSDGRTTGGPARVGRTSGRTNLL